MARAEDHVHLANKNHEVLQHLLAAHDRFPEWVTTVAFYKAVQIVDALCVVRRKLTPAGHPQRLEWLQRFPEFQPLYSHFRVLHSASSIARYLSDTHSNKSYRAFSDYLSPDEVVSELIAKRLIPIEQYGTTLFTDPLKQLLTRTSHAHLPKSANQILFPRLRMRLTLGCSPRFQALLDRSRRSIQAGKGLSEREFWQAVRKRARERTAAPKGRRSKP